MMLSLLIALKFHKGFKSNTLISLISLISIISISIGIMVSIIALSVINGFKYELKERILSFIPHIEIKKTNITLQDWQVKLTQIKSIPDVINVNPYVKLFGVVEYKNKWNAINIIGMDLIYNDICAQHNLFSFLEKDTWRRFCECKKQIILGNGIINDLGVKKNEYITVLITDNISSRNGFSSCKRINLQVSGVLKLNSQLDHNIAIIPFLDAQFYKGVSTIEGIAILVNDIFNVDSIIYKIKNVFDDDVVICSWIDIYGDVHKDIYIVKIIIYLSIILVIFIACFNVIITLIISIKNKIHDIKILCILGCSNLLIKYIFFWYGLIIYLISAFIGTGLGILISLYLNNLIMICEDLLGKKIIPKGIYFIDFLPSKLILLDIFIVLSVALIIGSLSSWYAVSKIKRYSLENMKNSRM